MRKPPAGLKARFLTPAVRFLLPSIHHPQAENPSPGPVSPTCCVSLCHLLRYAGFLSHLFDQFFSSNPPFLSASFCPPPFLFIIGLVAESRLDQVLTNSCQLYKLAPNVDPLVVVWTSCLRQNLCRGRFFICKENELCSPQNWCWKTERS